MQMLKTPSRPANAPFDPFIHVEGATLGHSLLEVEGIYAGYKDSIILKGVSMHLDPGEIICIIGPNGAGKSTLFKALYGFIEIRKGWVTFNGEDVTQTRPQDLLRAGIAMVPQLRSVFPQMTVQENLEMGMYLEPDKALVNKRINDIFDLFPHLAERARQKAGTLSGGEQRMLEISRALMIQPKIIMIDEPSAGLAPAIAKTIFENIMLLNREIGLSVLMIAQNARQGLGISHRGYVLEFGQNVYIGTGQELINHPEVRRSFLGGRHGGMVQSTITFANDGGQYEEFAHT